MGGSPEVQEVAAVSTGLRGSAASWKQLIVASKASKAQLSARHAMSLDAADSQLFFNFLGLEPFFSLV